MSWQPVGPKFCRILCSQTIGVKQCNYHIYQMKCEAADDEVKMGADVMLQTFKQGDVVVRIDVQNIPCGTFRNLLRICVDWSTAERTSKPICNSTQVKTFIKAIQDGNLSKVKRLLSKGMVDVDCRGDDGHTAIQTAAEFGFVRIFDFLVQRGCDMSVVNDYNNTLLHLACFGGNKFIVNRLLDDYNMDINIGGEDGRTPLMFAVEGCNIQVFKLLRNRGADIKVDKYFDTILHVACESYEPVKIIQFVLSLNIIDIDCKGDGGRTALMKAVGGKNIKVVKYLIKRGADIKTRDDMNNTILHAACVGGHVSMVKFILLKDFGGIDSIGKFGMSPLLSAVQNGHITVVNFLLRNYSADITTVDDDGLSALHLACEAGELHMVKYLIDLDELEGFDKMKTYGGQTPLNLARKNGHRRIVSFLRLRDQG